MKIIKFYFSLKKQTSRYIYVLSKLIIYIHIPNTKESIIEFAFKYEIKSYVSHETLLSTQKLTLEIYKAQKYAHEIKSWVNKNNVSVQNLCE